MRSSQHGHYIFQHNSDLSGNVKIIDKDTDKQVGEVNGYALVLFVAEYIRNKKIEELENASTCEIFNIEEM